MKRGDKVRQRDRRRRHGKHEDWELVNDARIMTKETSNGRRLVGITEGWLDRYRKQKHCYSLV